jgi:TRAP-type mannitol/chloroaromatic compound transport system permease large subunit
MAARAISTGLMLAALYIAYVVVLAVLRPRLAPPLPLSPPVAMAALYLKGVAPPDVTLAQIFAGVLPFMAIQFVAIVLLYLFPQIGLWLPAVLYG